MYLSTLVILHHSLLIFPLSCQQLSIFWQLCWQIFFVDLCISLHFWFCIFFVTILFFSFFFRFFFLKFFFILFRHVACYSFCLPIFVQYIVHVLIKIQRVFVSISPPLLFNPCALLGSFRPNNLFLIRSSFGSVLDQFPLQMLSSSSPDLVKT